MCGRMKNTRVNFSIALAIVMALSLSACVMEDQVDVEEDQADVEDLSNTTFEIRASQTDSDVSVMSVGKAVCADGSTRTLDCGYPSTHFAQDQVCSGGSQTAVGFVECTSGPKTGQRVECSPNLKVSLSCFRDFRTMSCSANASAGGKPYTYQWAYSGDASTWSSSQNQAIATWPPIGCDPSGPYSTFTVTVSHTCGNSVTKSRTKACPL